MSDKVPSSDNPGAGFSVELDFPDLYPCAVLYSLFDIDPTPLFHENLRLVKTRVYSGKDDDASRRAALLVSWDMLFEPIKGDQVYVAVPKDRGKAVTAPNTGEVKLQAAKTGIYITSKPGFTPMKKWIVSRSHSHRDSPIAWCLPIDVSPGAHPTFILSQQNVIDLSRLAQG